MTNIKIYSQARNVPIYYLEAQNQVRWAWGLKPPPPALLKKYIKEN